MSPREFQMYCASIRDTAAWGGEPEIMALSRAYNVPIHVIQAGKPPIVIHEPPPNMSDGVENKIVFISYHRRMYGLGEVSRHPLMHPWSNTSNPRAQSAALQHATTEIKTAQCDTFCTSINGTLATCTIHIRPLAPVPAPVPAPALALAPIDILKAACRQTRFAGSSLGLAGADPRRTQTHCLAWRKDHTLWVHQPPRLPPALILNSPFLAVVVPRSWA
jgi:hypothetical protein